MDNNKGGIELPSQSISWTASESIDHDRGPWWYVIAITVVIAAISVNFLLQGINASSISTAVLFAMALLAMLTILRRPSRELHYTLDNNGLTIENQLHSYDEFRAFGVFHDGALWQITLIPVKRFGLGLSMFIHDDQGEAIVDALGARMPMEETKIDLIDKIVRKLKI